ncbi:MAG: DNA recombination protein RmuC [Patescibacteria group bacterium]|nr:DNA recombination protein RmuC [Patescibacteria group bacterium]MCL5095234.1 DNA recombination protein RmuC [Patescibacteria group bacterium]
MSQEVYLLTALIIAGLAVTFYLLNKKLTEIKEATRPDETLKEWLKSQQETSQLTSKAINERLDNAARVISAVQKNIGEMSEIGRGMKELQEFLKSPKLRGEIGEEVLQDLISQMFPKNSFFLQHQFKSGDKVDAAIKTDAGILPIDSKFPMENFQKMVKSETSEERERAKKDFTRDIKAHVETISRKYILPEEGTMDFALMYVPSESVYYELVQIAEITDFAKKCRVYPVSPTTLYAHLQMILLSFEGKKIETKSREVFKLLRSIQGDYEKIEGNLSVLGSHIKNAYNQMSNVLSSFSLLGQKLSSTRSLGDGEEKDKEVPKLSS